jgi:hypothetical protein
MSWSASSETGGNSQRIVATSAALFIGVAFACQIIFPTRAADAHTSTRAAVRREDARSSTSSRSRAHAKMEPEIIAIEGSGCEH